MDAQPVLDRVAALTLARPASRSFVLVGIGGHGAAGKTTLAHMIPHAQVVSTDEFWDGVEFELSRLRAEVLEPILRGERAEYHAFSWELQTRLAEPRLVRPEAVIVIEGVCALHAIFREAYDLRVWVEAPRELRLARGIARDGEEMRRIWEEQWMPNEERYVQRDDPISAADLIVDGF
jgi:uridine kinase